ncbi:MAG: bifunctional ([pyruvate, phosphate dikinase] phosphate) phosphotransferase/[pyruvate, phosphate dikinase] kinase [Halobacteriovoraceae bacterium]|nr:bifunctional ([pyruvate, phosphate dikinase] phosphate) phosphotransferase/[pyruvate, phosphate dikinase] kinase [Peredibacter sp.]MBJ00377.1 bifunctional ([pyruvate, phosphate dikinase] phosphate) phosphotransferase/[pyruvate, phosphate dikinase] kinase [Halobacteriovoraceae bacterium]|tara:strand:+ start:10660 stop:11529 length:870 start_codon:yes stop_codon:yes gene_type:complete
MTIEPKKNLKVIVISDGTGETATAMTRAAITQFPDKEIFFTRFKNVRTKEHIDSIFQEAALHHDMVVYTIVSPELRSHVQEISRTEHVRSVDLLGPILTSFANIFEMEPDYQPGLLHAVNDQYFEKVAAVEFTLNHDDGRNVNTLEEADVVLVGISRTSKTPLSIYLSMEGIKVVNIPIVMDVPLPEKLFEIDQRKIFGLTIDPEALHQIRQNRLTRLGVDRQGDYADIRKVAEEIEWANNIFSQNKRWPVFNVTGKALEETAAEIIKMLNMRRANRFKVKKRFEKKKK